MAASLLKLLQTLRMLGFHYWLWTGNRQRVTNNYPAFMYFYETTEHFGFWRQLQSSYITQKQSLRGALGILKFNVSLWLLRLQRSTYSQNTFFEEHPWTGVFLFSRIPICFSLTLTSTFFDLFIEIYTSNYFSFFIILWMIIRTKWLREPF